jgi:acetyl-CoA carboxylase biotin carboxyl carrier protein
MSDECDLPLTPADVVEIIALLDGSEYRSLEISTARFTLKVARIENGSWTQEWHHSIAASSAETDTGQLAEAVSDSLESRGLYAIRPPIPGIFYHTPQPGAPPFIRVGEIITPDTVIGIIETMKLMTSVTADVSGEIIEITAKHGESVERGSILVLVRVSGQAQ